MGGIGRTGSRRRDVRLALDDCHSILRPVQRSVKVAGRTMTNADRILAALGSGGPLTDADLRRVTGIEPHQQVNQICRRFEREGIIKREPGPDGRILNKLNGQPSGRTEHPRPTPIDGPAAGVQAGFVADAGRPLPTDGSLFVLPCSGMKAPEGVAGVGDRHSIADLLPGDLAERFVAARHRSARVARLDESLLLPAWRRYDGTLYKRAQDALRSAVSAHGPVIVISGCYGLLLADELIGTYEKRFLLRDWPGGLLEACLLEATRRLGANRVLAFCARSTDYAEPVRRTRDVNPVSCPELGDAPFPDQSEPRERQRCRFNFPRNPYGGPAAPARASPGVSRAPRSVEQ